MQQAQAQTLEAVEQQRGAGERHPAKARPRQQVGQRDDQQAGMPGAQRGQVADLGDQPTRGLTAAIELGDALLDRRIQIALEKQ
ncbi:hypothetical protein D3C78_1405300 [compost metagenome]